MNKKISTGDFIDSILKAVVLSGMAGCIIITPNALIIGEKALTFLDNRMKRRKLAYTLSYMQRKSLIIYKKMPDGNLEIVLLEKGMKRVSKAQFENMKIARPKNWDKKWRLVMFDIPEKYRRSRAGLRQKLRLLGFYQLQKSAWIHPYPCREEIELIRKVYSISASHLVFAEVESIDHSAKLISRFKL